MYDVERTAGPDSTAKRLINWKRVSETVTAPKVVDHKNPMDLVGKAILHDDTPREYVEAPEKLYSWQLMKGYSPDRGIRGKPTWNMLS